jgi:smad nuclear-interacting protein 1
MKNGTVLKYHEPPEAKKCPGWRIYIFKDGKEIDVLELNGQSSFLVGRDRSVADIPVDHTSCSKQHAVIQFRQVSHTNKRGEVNKVTRYRTFWEGTDCRPYILDLEATNGTFLNGKRIEARRYVEIHSEDMVKFGESTREYVFIKDPSLS